jgi:hypothetical protein
MRDLFQCALVGSGLATIITFGMTMGLVAIVAGVIQISIGCCIGEEV